MRIIFEFTRVFRKLENNRGITRVNRNIGNNLHRVKDADCVPVIYHNSHYYDAQPITSPGICKDKISKIYLWLKNIQQQMFRWHNSLRSKAIFGKSPFFRQLLKVIYKVGIKPVSLGVKISAALRMKNTLKDLEGIDLQKGDVLVWPHPFGDEGASKRLSHLRAQGIYIVVLVYDLFPITRLNWFKTNKFNKLSTLEVADGFMAISKTVRNELQELIRKELSPRMNREFWCDYFYLGSELDRVDTDIQPRPTLKQLFMKRSSIYLMVGAIQMHKNHAYALDAFEKLWKKNEDVTLCIIGKAGGNSSKIIERIKRHPEWQKRLFMWNDACDTELQYCYCHAAALIFPSIDEGFGLPLIEAMQHQLPVMASDIPVFREIGREFVAYFDLNNPHNLCQLIVEYETTGVFPSTKPLNEWRWFTWEESVNQLMTKISQNLSSM